MAYRALAPGSFRGDVFELALSVFYISHNSRVMTHKLTGISQESSSGRRREQISPVRSPPLEFESGTADSLSDSSKDQDHFLPIANVSRIMKKSLPANAKISKEAKETVQECASEFISFITGEASDKCQREKRKTINGDDLLWAMTTLGFENYVRPLKEYLNKYREPEGEKNTMARQGDHEANSRIQDNVGNLVPTEENLEDFNSTGFYCLGAQVIPKNFWDEGEVIRHG
ncbi:hypothetical protein NE237_016435 [Protea cynaroides]|uniref:Transcription factor CBF/NF-Y/archaeal histone domain-containing protein n=1 Tax=Protea cynaroides TaxID=273540 RepID=A0A9Q0HG12_9MAGN|nr:hypothetical protein NE237_016435 [Protea cynaroides]